MTPLFMVRKNKQNRADMSDETTSHLNKLQKPQQVIGYAHSIGLRILLAA